MNQQIESKVALAEQSTNQHLKHVLWLMAFLIGAMAVCMSSTVDAADHLNIEDHCFNYVQDKVKWNYDNSSRWDPESVKQLCKGTSSAKQPGDCFHAVMHGGSYGNEGIEWGKGTKWNWKNAAALCSGANDADKRIGCFKGRIDKGHEWDAAIAECLLVDRS